MIYNGNVDNELLWRVWIGCQSGHHLEICLLEEKWDDNDGGTLPASTNDIKNIEKLNERDI